MKKSEINDLAYTLGQWWETEKETPKDHLKQLRQIKAQINNDLSYVEKKTLLNKLLWLGTNQSSNFFIPELYQTGQSTIIISKIISLFFISNSERWLTSTGEM